MRIASAAIKLLGSGDGRRSASASPADASCPFRSSRDRKRFCARSNVATVARVLQVSGNSQRSLRAGLTSLPKRPGRACRRQVNSRQPRLRAAFTAAPKDETYPDQWKRTEIAPFASDLHRKSARREAPQHARQRTRQTAPGRLCDPLRVRRVRLSPIQASFVPYKYIAEVMVCAACITIAARILSVNSNLPCSA